VTRDPSPLLPDTEVLFHEAKSFPKKYFHAGLVGYAIGMIATLLAMQLSSHPQPALLYLVPGVLGSLWVTAYLNGDIQSMWNFSDAVEEGEGKGVKGHSKTDKQTENPLRAIFGRISFRQAKTDPLKNNKAPGDVAKGGQTVTAGSMVNFDNGVEIPEKESTIKQNKAEGENAAQDGKSKDREQDKSRSLEIVSFSISLPRKSQRHQAKARPTGSPVDETIPTREVSIGSGITSSSPTLVERDGEPPLKRRKRVGELDTNS